MSGFGKSQEVSEGSVRKLWTGVENFKVLTVNPTKEELENIYGRELNFTPEYLKKTTVTDGDGEREALQIRLNFILANEDETITTKAQFYVVQTHHKSQGGTLKVLNVYGKSTWLSEEHIKANTVPDNMHFYSTESLKVAYRGEEEVIDFLTNLLNLPNINKASDPSDCHAYISKEVWAKIFQGDTTFFRNIIDGTNNKVGQLLGVKTKGDGKQVQVTYTRKALRQYTKNSTSSTKYDYLDKSVKNAQAGGAFGNVDFGGGNYDLVEYTATPSVISQDQMQGADPFAAPVNASETIGADDDWMNM